LPRPSRVNSTPACWHAQEPGGLQFFLPFWTSCLGRGRRPARCRDGACSPLHHARRQCHVYEIAAVALSPDDQWLVSPSWDGLVRLRTGSDGALRRVREKSWSTSCSPRPCTRGRGETGPANFPNSPKRLTYSACRQRAGKAGRLVRKGIERTTKAAADSQLKPAHFFTSVVGKFSQCGGQSFPKPPLTAMELSITCSPR
jgi:hypothetical protein